MKTKFLVLLVNLLLILVLGEIVSRVFPQLFDKPPPFNTAVLDAKLGWLQKGNYQYEGKQASLNKELYPVKLSYEKNGFRKYAASKDSLPRILILGDSFTQAIEVSDGKVYYDYLERESLSRVYAYGVAGYGTLQEYMILDKYVDEIQPDVVVIQFCSNDFIDNDLEMEQNASYQVGLWRPYLQENGRISYGNPLGIIERNLIKSKFLKFFRDKWIRVKYRLDIKKQNVTEERIVKEGKKFEAYQRSQQVTRIILEKIKTRIGASTRLVVMNADSYVEQATDLERICEALDLALVRFPKQLMEEARKKNEVYTLDGFHWNEQGHRIIGENLRRTLTTFINR